MFGNIYRRIAALPLAAKVLMALVALLVLAVAVIAVIFRALRRGPLRNWGLIALLMAIESLPVYTFIPPTVLRGEQRTSEHELIKT